jgi:phage terminase small subunit
MPRQRELNSRQKKFCQLYVQGETAGNIAQSHRKAGYVCPTIEGHGGNGIRLLRSERIQKEIAKLREKAFSREALTYSEKRAWLARAVRTSVGEIHEGSDLAQEVTISEGKEGTSRKVKAVDKLRAIELDSKLAGDFYADRTPQASNPFLMIVSLGKYAPSASLLGESQSVSHTQMLREPANVIEAEIVEPDIANDPLP